MITAKANPEKQGHAEQAVNYISQQHSLEKHADENQVSPNQRYGLRQGKAKAIILEFKELLTQTSLITPPKGLLGKAANCALHIWERLVR